LPITSEQGRDDNVTDPGGQLGTLNNERIRILKPNELVFEKVPVSAEVGDDQLLIRTLYSLISPGTELGLYSGSNGAFGDKPETEDPWFPKFSYPLAPGYAAVGEIMTIGSKWRSTFNPGDIVYFPGHHERFAVVSPSVTPVVPVPSGVSLQSAPFARFAQIAGTAPTFSHAGKGDVVAVIGLGLIGHLAAQWFRIRGAIVIGADLHAYRRDLATQSGIHQTIDAGSQDTVAAVLEATNGIGARTVVQATQNPRLIEPALRMVAQKGEVILLGSPLTASDRNQQMSVYILHLIHRRGIHVIGAHETLIPRVVPGDVELDQQRLAQNALDLIGSGQLLVDHLVTDVIGPHDIERAYRSLANDLNSTMTFLIDWTQT
jgi:2-desacetyl-2-hydroxyethyl bacteriochlorophyllide A dehydrogenase